MPTTNALQPMMDPPRIFIDATSLDFGYSSIGTKKSLSFNINNEGELPLKVNMTVGNPDQYDVMDSTSITVLPWTLRAVVVSFMPNIADTFVDTLSILSNDS